MHEIGMIIKKAVGISLYFIYYSFFLLFLASEMFNDVIFLATIVINYLIHFIDALIRAESEEEEKSKSEIIMAIAFLLQPFIVITVFYENKLFISESLEFWDNPLISYAGIIILIVGGIVLLVSRISIGRYGSGKIVLEDHHELVTSGIYGYIRHPIYLGGLIGWVGLSLAFRGVFTLLVFLIIYFLLFKSRMDLEERILTSEFGQEYLSYMKRTKRLIPFIY